eukprot:1188254-Prorocentrum_minimum.AAC.2
MADLQRTHAHAAHAHTHTRPAHARALAPHAWRLSPAGKPPPPSRQVGRPPACCTCSCTAAGCGPSEPGEAALPNRSPQIAPPRTNASFVRAGFVG